MSIDISKETPLKVQIGRFECEYVAVKTTAPQSYDYDSAIELYAAPDDSFRIVLVDASRAEFQTGRYASGLHTAEIMDSADEASIRAKLVERLYGREEG